MMKNIPIFLFISLSIACMIISCDDSGSVIATECSERISFDQMIPMQDGNELASTIYLPDCDKLFPTVLIQTPYNRKSLENIFFGYDLPLVNSYDYAFVVVDNRGFYGSSSAYVYNYNRGLDGYDVVEWIAAQEWSDGKVGGWGASALGRQQFYTAAENPPSLTCIVPSVSIINQTYTDVYPGGVFREEYIETLGLVGFGVYNLYRSYPYHNNLWELYENIRSADEINVPCLMVSGWYDLHTSQSIDDYYDIKENGGENARDDTFLLVGSWHHLCLGGEGMAGITLTDQELLFKDNDNVILSKSKEFFDYYLLGIDSEVNEWSNVTYHDYGADTWLETEDFPPAGTNESILYLNPDNSLKTTAPTETSFSAGYVYDPDDPSPTIGGPTLGTDVLHGPANQYPDVETRDDIVIFTTDTLTDPITVNGLVYAVLYVETDAADTDFVVRLTDVSSDTMSLLIMDGVQRLKLKDDLSTPAVITPGTIYQITVNLTNYVSHTFNEGHKLRIIVSSSNYPRFEINPNNGDNFPGDSTNITATNKIWIDNSHQSRIVMQVSNN